MAPRLHLSTCGLYNVYVLQMLYVNTYLYNTGTILFFSMTLGPYYLSFKKLVGQKFQL